MTLVSVTAYHSFSGEVEALNTPTIRRLTPSRRHQLPRITPGEAKMSDIVIFISLILMSAVFIVYGTLKFMDVSSIINSPGTRPCGRI
jgi:uncharacterized membrane protein YidH (DUF202 family)